MNVRAGWLADPSPRPAPPHPNPHVEALRLAATHHENKAAVYRRRGYLTAAALSEGQAIGLRHAIDIIGASHQGGTTP